MKKQLVTTLLLLSFPLIYVSCVTSLLKDAPPTFSSEIKLVSPQAPFVQMKTSVYPSWKSSKSGNVISIISDCDPNSSATLITLHQMVEDSLTDVETIKEETTVMQNKPAYFKKISGRLDGHTIDLQSFSFKRKNCGYISSLAGKKESLDQDKVEFDRFNANLRFE